MARITPLDKMIDLVGRRGRFRFRSDLQGADRFVFAVDLYSHLRESHPETHVGYWVFRLPEGEAESTIGIDLTRIESRIRIVEADLGIGHSRQEKTRIGVLRIGQHLMNIAPLDDLPRIHHEDVLGDIAGGRQVVGDVEQRDTKIPFHLIEQVQDTEPD